MRCFEFIKANKHKEIRAVALFIHACVACLRPILELFRIDYYWSHSARFSSMHRSDHTLVQLIIQIIIKYSFCFHQFDF